MLRDESKLPWASSFNNRAKGMAHGCQLSKHPVKESHSYSQLRFITRSQLELSHMLHKVTVNVANLRDSRNVVQPILEYMRLEHLPHSQFFAAR